MTRLTYDMSNATDAVDPMVLTLRAQATRVLSDKARFRFELCVTEALTNLVTHAAPQSDAPVKITLTLETGIARIEIFDPVGAAPFDLRSHVTQIGDVDAMAEGGRGLGLIMECADSVTYGPKGADHVLCLDFYADPVGQTMTPVENGTRE